MKSDQWLSSNWKSLLLGLAAGIITIIVLEAGKALNIRILNPNLLFALTIGWSAYKGGRISGLCTAFLGIIYTMFDWSLPGHLFTYTPNNMQRLIVVLICMPIMAFLVGLLKSQSDAQQKALSSYLSIEKEKNRYLTEALSEKKVPEGSLPLCAWCQRARQDDGQWVKLDQYLHNKYGLLITHGICSDCSNAIRKK